MERAKSICENLMQQYPNDSFVAFMNCIRTTPGYMDFTTNFSPDPNVSIHRLLLSSMAAIGDSELTSLLQPVVFKSKSMSNIAERAQYLCDEIQNTLMIQKLLPGYYYSMFISFVFPVDVRPLVYGPHKGLAYFPDPDIGLNVTIVLQ